MSDLCLAKLRLKNYCSYDDFSFDFLKPDGSPYPFICFFGPNGIGKCLNGTTFVTTKQHGMIQIKRLFDNFKLTPDTWYPANNLQIAINGSWGRVSGLYYSGKRKTIKIKTKLGYVLEGSFDRHKILSIIEGSEQFQYLRDLNIGNLVCISRKEAFPLSHNRTSIGIAHLLGYIVSEGWVSSKCIRFSNSDQEVLEHFYSLCQDHLEFFNSSITGNKQGSVFINARDRSYLSTFGLTDCLSGEKTVPNAILGSSKEVISAFLQAYFEGDGGVENSIQAVTCCSKSYELLHQIHLLLLRLGIISSLRPKHTPKLSYTDKPYDSWRITIQGDNVLKYARQVGFISSCKKNALDDLLLEMSLVDRNPKMVKHGVSRSKIESCLATIHQQIESQSNSNILTDIDHEFGLGFLKDDYFYDSVESIEHSEDDLFDLCVEDEHCFWSNGFISHNSTLLEAISLLTMNNHGRTRLHVREALFKYVRNKNYDPLFPKGEMKKGWQAAKEKEKLPDMLIEGTFLLNGKKYIVQINQDGFIRNDLAPIPHPDADEDEAKEIQNSGPFGRYHLLFRQRISHFFKTDSDLSMNKFQIHISQAENFEKIISQIMRYEADCIAPSGLTEEERQYCTDFVIHKRGHQIHYKRMSAGERKICKSFSSLLNMMNDLANPETGEIRMPGWPRLLLIDNVEMHVYFDRHVKLIESLREVFNRQQIFATTHSGVLVPRYIEGKHDQENELYINLEPING